MMGGAPLAPRQSGPSSEVSLDLWLVDLAAGAALLNEVAGEHRLNPQATARGALATAAPRETARAALRILLAGYVGVTEARRPFQVATAGKPSLAHIAIPPLEFSLAHCDAYALIAISRDGPVGVDLEASRSVRISDRRRAGLIAAADALCPAEPLPQGPGEARFLQAWTRLEALAKASGEGLGPLLERLRKEGPPVAQTTVAGRPVWVRDVRAASAPSLFAAVAGTGASPASAARPEPVAVPLERSWLARWLAGDRPEAPPASPPSHQN